MGKGTWPKDRASYMRGHGLEKCVKPQKRENDIDEQRSDIATGLDLPIQKLGFTKRWASLLFLRPGPF